MKKINILFSVVIILFASCNNEESKDNLDGAHPIKGENFNFYKSESLFKQANDLRSEEYSDAFEIVSVARKADILDITVSYPNGCNANEFDVIWDGYVLESYPPQIILILKRSADGCDADSDSKVETLSIDLNELIGDSAIVDATLFHVLNASKKLDESGSAVTSYSIED